MPCYQPPASRQTGPGVPVLIAIILGVPALYLWIRVFFGMMPVMEAFGRFVCHYLIGPGL